MVLSSISSKMRILIILLLFIPQYLFGQVFNTDSLNLCIEKLIKDHEIPGLAVGVVYMDSVVFKNGYGVTSVQNGKPVTTQTTFPIMSCTKAFTATCLGILVDEGKLDWNDKVIEHLPNFKLSDPWITAELTISDLLTHRSGLRRYDGDLLWYGTNYSKEEIIEKIQHYPITGSFRLDFNYQNVMYLVAGTIIEKVSGSTWDSFLRERIFDPLSMIHSSTTLLELTESESYAHPHIANKPITPRSLDNVGPAGSINSSIEDMLIWLKINLEQGSLTGQKIVKKSTYQTITSPKIITDQKSCDGYGFGWKTGFEHAQRVVYHGGGMPGYRSMITLYPESEIGIVVLANKLTLTCDNLAEMIADYLLHPEKANWSDNRKYFNNFRFSWDDPKTLDMPYEIPDDFSRYVGKYTDKIYGDAEVKVQNGVAMLTLLPSPELFSGKLYFLNETKFKVQFNDEFLPIGEVIFNKDSLNNISGFKLKISSDDFNFDNLDFTKTKTHGTKH